MIHRLLVCATFLMWCATWIPPMQRVLDAAAARYRAATAPDPSLIYDYEQE
jgi:hypothetical protein